MTTYEVFSLKQVGFLAPSLQIFLICFLFVFTILQQHKEYKQTGKVWGVFPLKTSSFFAAIYEEVIFRGFIFIGLMSAYSLMWSIIISSILFGLWHLKNIFYLLKKELLGQITIYRVDFWSHNGNIYMVYRDNMARSDTTFL